MNRKSANKDYDIKIEFFNNTINAEYVRKDGLVFLSKELLVENNIVNIGKFSSSAFIKAYGTSGNTATINNTAITISDGPSNTVLGSFSVSDVKKNGNDFKLNK